MADPRRYDVYAVLKTGDGDAEAGLTYSASKCGEWVKWHDFVDFKAAQRRNKSESMVEKLGLECIELRVRIEDMEAEMRALKAQIAKK